MIATHDLDFMLWWMEPAKPVRVFAQSVSRVFKDSLGVPDATWIIVTMDDGAVFTVGANWLFPPSTAHFGANTIQIIGTEGAINLDDTHADTVVRTMKDGMYFPLATRPGEQVGHVFQGPIQAETAHFLECVATGRPHLVTLEQALRVMEVTHAADLSAERGMPVDLPLPRE
jgi:scyllo-inositol 2-dehydrogenase (NAD+)